MKEILEALAQNAFQLGMVFMSHPDKSSDWAQNERGKLVIQALKDLPTQPDSVFSHEAVFGNMLRSWTPEDCKSFYAMLSLRPDFNPQPPAAGTQGARDDRGAWAKVIERVHSAMDELDVAYKVLAEEFGPIQAPRKDAQP